MAKKKPTQTNPRPKKKSTPAPSPRKLRSVCPACSPSEDLVLDLPKTMCSKCRLAARNHTREFVPPVPELVSSSPSVVLSPPPSPTLESPTLPLGTSLVPLEPTFVGTPMVPVVTVDYVKQPLEDTIVAYSGFCPSPDYPPALLTVEPNVPCPRCNSPITSHKHLLGSSPVYGPAPAVIKSVPVITETAPPTWLYLPVQHSISDTDPIFEVRKVISSVVKQVASASLYAHHSCPKSNGRCTSTPVSTFLPHADLVHIASALGLPAYSFFESVPDCPHSHLGFCMACVVPSTCCTTGFLSTLRSMAMF
jgi:hypothetical protein